MPPNAALPPLSRRPVPRGKLLIALVVASAHAAVLFYVGLDLFLVFGLLSFALNFVPAIGMLISILLPMPLVALDDGFTPSEALLALLLPLLVGTAAKDIMEPLLIGSATRLQPVAMLLATLLWGGIWGITGMVIAVPVTAVCRVYMQNIPHPLTRYVASKLAGDDQASLGVRLRSPSSPGRQPYADMF